MKELHVLGNAFSHVTTGTVVNNETVNAQKVEHHQVVEAGRMGTHATNTVAKLDDEAKCGKGGFFKKLAVLFLRHT